MKNESLRTTYTYDIHMYEWDFYHVVNTRFKVHFLILTGK